MGAQEISSSPEFKYQVVDLDTDLTVVASVPGMVVGLYVNVVLSAQDLLIKDGATTVFTIPASTAAGTFFDFKGVRFETDITVDPDDAATGSVTIIFKSKDDIRNF